MSVWEILTSAVSDAVSDYDYLGAKTTWNTIQGTSFTNIIGLPGGSRVNNVMGSDVRIVCPWLGLLARHILGPTTEVGTKGLLTGGIGGDTDMVFGKKNFFTYFSATANCEFGINKLEINYQVPDGIDISTYFKGAGVRALYYLPAITAQLGALVLTVMTLCLKHIWKFSSSTDPSNDKTVMNRAMMLFPLIESEWLYLIQLLHDAGAALIPLKISNWDQLLVSSSTTPILEAQVIGLEEEIKYGKQMAEDMELSLKEMVVISGENPAFCALSEPSMISIVELVGNEAEKVEQNTVTKAQSIVEIIKPQT